MAQQPPDFTYNPNPRRDLPNSSHNLKLVKALAAARGRGATGDAADPEALRHALEALANAHGRGYDYQGDATDPAQQWRELSTQMHEQGGFEPVPMGPGSASHLPVQQPQINPGGPMQPSALAELLAGATEMPYQPSAGSLQRAKPSMLAKLLAGRTGTPY